MFNSSTNFPPFKINGTNADLQRFEADCKRLGYEISKANGYFRDDYEHCLMPAYSYYKGNADNIKLQLLSSDAYFPEIVFDLKSGYYDVLAFVERLNTHFAPAAQK